MDLPYLALKFIVGGMVILGVTFLAQQVDARYAGILIAAPVLTIMAFLFTYSENGLEVSRQVLIGSFWFVIPTMLFILALWLLLARYPVAPSLGGAFCIWIAALLLMNRALSVF